MAGMHLALLHALHSCGCLAAAPVTLASTDQCSSQGSTYLACLLLLSSLQCCWCCCTPPAPLLLLCCCCGCGFGAIAALRSSLQLTGCTCRRQQQYMSLVSWDVLVVQAGQLRCRQGMAGMHWCLLHAAGHSRRDGASPRTCVYRPVHHPGQHLWCLRGAGGDGTAP